MNIMNINLKFVMDILNHYYYFTINSIYLN